jgi:hypothetical protein
VGVAADNMVHDHHTHSQYHYRDPPYSRGTRAMAVGTVIILVAVLLSLPSNCLPGRLCTTR